MVDLGQKRWKRFHLFYWNKFYNIVSTKINPMKQFTKISLIVLFSLFLFNCSGAKPKNTLASTSTENQSSNKTSSISKEETSSNEKNSNEAGSSTKNAIKVKSIAEEYQIVKKLCPNCKINGQALISEGKKHYDVLNLTNEKGEAVKYYFDINSFFGKW